MEPDAAPPLVATPPSSSARRFVGYGLATWFGCGRMPKAPGTMGTIGALPLYLLVRPYGPVGVGITAVAITLVGLWATAIVVAHEQSKDPQHVVIDEVAGVLVTLTVAPATASWKLVALGVVAFRIFDMWKPWPARALERGLKGAPGVIFDDVAAGVWGAGVVWIVEKLGLLP